MTAKMDANHLLQITLTTIGFLLTGILSILAYFIKKWIDSVEILAATVRELKEAFIEQRGIHKSFEERFWDYKKHIEERFQDIETQVSDNTELINKNCISLAETKNSLAEMKKKH